MVELSEAQVRVVVQALGELPLKVSGDVFGVIQQQLASQTEVPDDKDTAP